VDEIEDFAEVTAEPVEGVDDDGVAAPGVGEQGGEAVAVDGGAGLLVGVDVLVGDAGGGEGVELAVEVLLDSGDAGVAEVEAAGGVLIAGGHRRAVPEVGRGCPFWNGCFGPVSGTESGRVRSPRRPIGRPFHSVGSGTSHIDTIVVSSPS
jgi:hypothetical protein